MGKTVVTGTLISNRSEFRYTQYYCEENIWHLSQHSQFNGLQKYVVFISNENKRCLFWNQSAAGSRERPLWWDYHVVFMCKLDLWLVWDLDTMVGFPIPCSDYLQLTFGKHEWIPERQAPYFRVVEADQFISEFSSDRSHMRTEAGEWLAPPPPWPPILQGNQNTLNDFLVHKAGLTFSHLNRDETGLRKVKFSNSSDIGDMTVIKFGMILTLEEFTRKFAM